MNSFSILIEVNYRFYLYSQVTIWKKIPFTNFRSEETNDLLCLSKLVAFVNYPGVRIWLRIAPYRIQLNNKPWSTVPDVPFYLRAGLHSPFLHCDVVYLTSITKRETEVLERDRSSS